MSDFWRIFIFSFLLNAPYYLLCCIPFFSKLKVKKQTLISMILLTTLMVAFYYGMRELLLPGARWLDSIVLLLFYMIYLVQYIFSFRIALSKLLYIFLVVQAYSNILNLTAKYIDIRLFTDDMSIVASTPYGLIYIGLLVVTYPILYRFFQRRLSRAFDSLSGKSFWLLNVTPALFFIINILYTSVVIRSAFSDPEIFAIYFLVLLTGFVTYFVTLRAAMDAAKGARLQADNENIGNQLALQALNYEQLTQNIEQTRAARHDLRHHLTVITAYVEKDDKTGLNEYLKYYRESLPEDTQTPVCENYAVDTVARYYMNKAKEAGAILDVRLVLPCDVGIPDSDLCIIFGNLFENAANSVYNQQTGDKFINARCSLEEGKLVLTVDNSMGDNKRKERGVGQSSVTAVAKKYGGGVRFEAEGKVYRSSVMLLLPDAVGQEKKTPVQG